MVSNISAVGSFDLISFIILPFVFLLMSGCRPQVTHYLLRGHQFSAQPLVFSPDGQWLATTDSQKTSRLYALSNLETEPTILSPNEGGEVMIFNQDGTWLASSRFNDIHLWSISSGY